MGEKEETGETLATGQRKNGIFKSSEHKTRSKNPSVGTNIECQKKYQVLQFTIKPDYE